MSLIPYERPLTKSICQFYLPKILEQSRVGIVQTVRSLFLINEITQYTNYNQKFISRVPNYSGSELVFQYQEQINWEIETQATVMDKKDIIREVQQEAEHLDFQIQKLVEEVENDYKLPIAFIGGSLQKMKEALEKRQHQAQVIEQSAMMLIQGIMKSQKKYKSFVNHQKVQGLFKKLVEAPNILASLPRKYEQITTQYEARYQEICSENQKFDSSTKN